MKGDTAKTAGEIAKILSNPEDYQKAFIADAQIQFDLNKKNQKEIKKMGQDMYEEKCARYIKSLGNPAFITERKLKTLPSSLLLNDQQKRKILNQTLRRALDRKSTNQTDYSGYMDF